MYVVIYTYQRPGQMEYFPEIWADDEQTSGQSIFSVIESQAQGSQIRSLADKGSVPYLLFYRKNHALIYEGIANQLEETISFDYNFISHASTGEITSTLIGPARTWKQLIWENGYSEVPVTDGFTGALVAYSRSMGDSLEVDITSLQDTVLTFINAVEYPFIRLRFQTNDLFNLTPARVHFWRILYEGVPDLLLNPGGVFEFEGDSLQPGQPMHLVTAVENIGEDLDTSVLARFTITDAGHDIEVEEQEVPALASGESVLIQLDHKAAGKAGNSSILLEVNADRRIEEASYLNNTGIINYVQLADLRNPLLDVTFDGRHLIDGDVVSAQPVILATLSDDNPYLPLDKPEIFSMMLRYPGEFDYTSLDVHGTEMQFTPDGPGPENEASLAFRPILEPGFYDLEIQAIDGSDNEAGSVGYRVSFEVIGEPLISRVDALPRWFNDHTRFTFTISGTVVPSEIRLEIFNASGQVLRSIGKDEIGLFVGTTEYVWDGTTDSGEKLAAGVYFYRLIAKDHNGRDYQMLGPGFRDMKDARVGKLVIVR
jgi:hypothetical protein